MDRRFRAASKRRHAVGLPVLDIAEYIMNAAYDLRNRECVEKVEDGKTIARLYEYRAVCVDAYYYLRILWSEHQWLTTDVLSKLAWTTRPIQRSYCSALDASDRMLQVALSSPEAKRQVEEGDGDGDDLTLARVFSMIPYPYIMGTPDPHAVEMDGMVLDELIDPARSWYSNMIAIWRISQLITLPAPDMTTHPVVEYFRQHADWPMELVKLIFEYNPVVPFHMRACLADNRLFGLTDWQTSSSVVFQFTPAWDHRPNGEYGTITCTPAMNVPLDGDAVDSKHLETKVLHVHSDLNSRFVYYRSKIRLTSLDIEEIDGLPVTSEIVEFMGVFDLWLGTHRTEQVTKLNIDTLQNFPEYDPVRHTFVGQNPVDEKKSSYYAVGGRHPIGDHLPEGRFGTPVRIQTRVHRQDGFVYIGSSRPEDPVEGPEYGDLNCVHLSLDWFANRPIFVHSSTPLQILPTERASKRQRV